MWRRRRTPTAKFADLLTKVKRKETVGTFRMGWVMDYPSMENYLGPLYSTGGSSNYYGYSNAQFDRLVQEGRATVELGAVGEKALKEEVVGPGAAFRFRPGTVKSCPNASARSETVIGVYALKRSVWTGIGFAFSCDTRERSSLN